VDVSFKEAESLPANSEVIIAKSADGREVKMEVVEQLENDVTRCICLSLNFGLKRNSEAIATGSVIEMPDSTDCCGRLIDALGAPLDNRGPIKSDKPVPIRQPSIVRKDEVRLEERREYRIMVTGVKVIDLLFPLVVGSKPGILAVRHWVRVF